MTDLRNEATRYRPAFPRATYRLAIGLAAAMLGSGAVSPPAMATEQPSRSVSPIPIKKIANLDQATVDDTLASLPSSPLPRRSHRERNATVTSYEIGSGFTINTVETKPHSGPPTDTVSFLGGGWDASGPYVDLNRTDQGVVASGGAAGLAGALCTVPGVGVPLCVSASAVLAAAAEYIASAGLCGGDLRIHIQELGYPECV